MTDNVIILRPARVHTFNAGRKVHGFSDDLLGRIGPYIRRKVGIHCGEHYEYIVIREYGQGAHIPAQAWQREIDDERREWLRFLAVEVNSRCAGPGIWVLAWDNANDTAPRVFTMLWFDDDGDLQLEAKEEGMTFEQLKRTGFEKFVENAATCIAIWAEQFLEVEVNPDQQIKLAQGETR